MPIYKKPNIFFTGSEVRAKQLIGISNAFRFKTDLWNKEKYYKLSTKLDDGSIITIQKLMNGELYTFIDTPILEDEEAGITLPLFIFEKITDNTPLLAFDPLISDKTRGLSSSDPFILEDSNTLNSNDGGTKELAGNIDWRGSVDGDIISWHGSYDRYRNHTAYYIDVAAPQFNTSSSSFHNIWPHGYVNKYDILMDINTKVSGFPDDLRSIRHTQLSRYGTSLFSGLLEIASTSDIIESFLGSKLIVGAGIHNTQTLAVIKDTGELDKFYLYNIDRVTSAWTRLSTIDLSDTVWHYPGVFHGFFFNQDGTKIVSIIRQYKKEVTYTNTLFRTRFEVGSEEGNGIALDTRDLVVEISLTEIAGEIIGSGSIAALKAFNYARNNPNFALQTRLIGDEYYRAIDYKDNILNPLIENFSTTTWAVTADLIANARLSIEFDGHVIPSPNSTTERDDNSFVQYSDLRHGFVFMMWDHQPNLDSASLPSVNNWETVLYRDISGSLTSESMFTANQEIGIGSPFSPEIEYFIKGITVLGAPGDTVAQPYVVGAGYCFCGIGKDGNIFWYTSVGRFRLLPDLINFVWERLFFGFNSNEEDVLSEIFQDVPALDFRRLSTYHDYYSLNFRNNELERDIGICPI